MKPKQVFIPIATFVAGVVVGVALLAVVVIHGPNQVIANMAQGYTSEQAIYATLLSEKRYDDLQRLIESGFLISLNFQKGLNLSANGYLASQKLVRGYYDFTGRQIPEPIAQHIRAFGKGAGTDIRSLADTAVTTSTNLSPRAH